MGGGVRAPKALPPTMPLCVPNLSLLVNFVTYKSLMWTLIHARQLEVHLTKIMEDLAKTGQIPDVAQQSQL